MERSLNHCFTTWLNPYNKRGRYKKKEKMGRKRLWVRLSGNLMDPNWRLCFPALLREARNLDSISQADKWLLVGHSLLPLQWPAAPLWPSAGLPSRIYFYREHPIHILPAKVYIKVELGCTYNGRWSKLYPSYSTPPHLLTVWGTDSAGFQGAASPWHEKGSHAMPLSATDLVHGLTMMWCPAWKKKSLCQVRLFLLISINEANSSVLPYRWTHSWENVFFFLCLVGAMASPFFLSLTGLVVPVLPRLSRYCLLPISPLGL